VDKQGLKNVSVIKSIEQKMAEIGARESGQQPAQGWIPTIHLAIGSHHRHLVKMVFMFTIMDL
jgi:hypothetical protein